MKCKKGIPPTAEVLHVLIDKMEVFPDAKVFEFSDDGYSGTNFDRLGIQELLDRVRNYEINCIIVKDFSRFARDYIELGSYM